jgi:hypothetical protein
LHDASGSGFSTVSIELERQQSQLDADVMACVTTRRLAIAALRTGVNTRVPATPVPAHSTIETTACVSSDQIALNALAAPHWDVPAAPVVTAEIDTVPPVGPHVAVGSVPKSPLRQHSQLLAAGVRCDCNSNSSLHMFAMGGLSSRLPALHSTTETAS